MVATCVEAETSLKLAELRPPRVGLARVVVRPRLGVVERLAADRAKARAIGAAEEPLGQRQGERVVAPGGQVEIPSLTYGLRSSSSSVPGWSTSRASTSTATRAAAEAAHARPGELAGEGEPHREAGGGVRETSSRAVTSGGSST